MGSGSRTSALFGREIMAVIPAATTITSKGGTIFLDMLRALIESVERLARRGMSEI